MIWSRFSLKSTIQFRIHFVHITIIILTRDTICTMFVETHWRVPWSQNDLLYRIEPYFPYYIWKLSHNGRTYHFSCSLYHALALYRWMTSPEISQIRKLHEMSRIEMNVYNFRWKIYISIHMWLHHSKDCSQHCSLQNPSCVEWCDGGLIYCKLSIH